MGYAAPPMLPKTSSNAVIALVLAIASFFICPVVPAIVALVMASTAQREISVSGGWVTGGGLVTAARWIAWINIAIGVLVVIFFAIALIASTTASH